MRCDLKRRGLFTFRMKYRSDTLSNLSHYFSFSLPCFEIEYIYIFRAILSRFNLLFPRPTLNFSLHREALESTCVLRSHNFNLNNNRVGTFLSRPVAIPYKFPFREQTISGNLFSRNREAHHLANMWNYVHKHACMHLHTQKPHTQCEHAVKCLSRTGGRTFLPFLFTTDTTDDDDDGLVAVVTHARSGVCDKQASRRAFVERTASGHPFVRQP